MAISPKILLIFLTILPLATPDSNRDLISSLTALQSQSKTGIIHLNDNLLSRFITSAKTPRPYSLLIFFDAKQLHDKPELHLQHLHKEFSILATSFITNNPNNHKLFFCDIEFKESQHSFSLFGVNSLPHVRLVGPGVDSLKDSEKMEQGDFSRLAESMSEFVAQKLNLNLGPIHRPPILSNKQIMIVAVLIFIWIPFVVKRVLTSETILHDTKLWLSGAVVVYFFSVSGSMHNIIRNMPMFLVDRNDPNKLVFFYQGSGMQLGAEGFAVGFLYTVVGLLLALVTHLLVRVRNLKAQRLIMIFAIFVSFWAVKKVVYLDNWKTGYRIHAFWPSSWS